MRFFVLLLVLPFFTNAQYVDEFLATTMLPLNTVQPFGLTIDSNDNALMFFRYSPEKPEDSMLTYIHNSFESKYQITSTNRNQQFVFNSYKSVSPIDSTFGMYYSTMPNFTTLNGINFNFFIFNAVPIADSLEFLGRKMSIDKNCNSCRLIIKTSKQNKILQYRTIDFPNFNLIGQVINDKDELLFYGLGRDEINDYTIDSFKVKGAGKQFAHNIIKINTELRVSNFLRYNIGNKSGLISPIGYITWITNVNQYLDEDFHIAQLSKENTSSSDSFHYGFHRITNDFSIEKIDSFKCNFFINSTAISENHLFFTAQFYDSILYINNNKWTAPVEKGFLLGKIDSAGRIEILKHVFVDNPGFRGPDIKAFKDRIFLRLNTNSTFVYNGKEYGEDFQLTEYFFAFDTNGNQRLFFHSPGEYSSVLGRAIETYYITDEYIHIMSQVGVDFTINNKLYKLNSDDDRFDNAMYAKIRYAFEPTRKPLFSIDSTNCSSIRINIEPTEAEHYTVIIHDKPAFTQLANNQNYNYSQNFLIAPKMGQSQRLMYQGSDTVIDIFNLPVNKKLYISVIAGTGKTGAVSYNLDSVLTLSISLSYRTLQPLGIYPKQDTTLCQYDTLYTEAISSFPIRWMDGKTDNRRFVTVTGNYYFTIKDSQGCVLSSDTINITKNPNPVIKSINPLSKLPFCLGDSVLFITNSTELIRFVDSSKYVFNTATKTSWLTFKLINDFGCTAQDSIYVEFGQYPKFKFLQDCILSLDRNIKVEYNTNADSLIFVYGTDSLNHYSNFRVKDSQFLYVNAFSKSGCNIWDSILTHYHEPVTEIFPNAFSPNGDGLNDVWYFIHPDTAGILMIYDRWGGTVYQGANTWDGKKNGEILPVGAYRYTFKFIASGEEKVRKGIIYLIR